MILIGHKNRLFFYDITGCIDPCVYNNFPNDYIIFPL